MGVRTAARLLAAGLAGAVLALVGYGAATAPSPDAPPPPALSNAAENLARARPPQDGRFRFGVLGDIQGTARGIDLLRRLRDEPLSCLVLVGDAVRSGRLAQHQWLAEEVRRLEPWPFPIAYAVGNREIKETGFTLESFRARYGRARWSFSVGDALLVGTVFADRRWAPLLVDSEAHLAETLAAQAARHRLRFVFAHLPLEAPTTPEVLGRGLHWNHGQNVERTFLEHGVQYYVAGHVHGYLRRQRQGVTHLVTAGGGGRLVSKGHGSMHHAVIFEVGPEGVSEHLLVSEGWVDPGPALRRLAAFEVVPWIQRRPAAGLLVVLAAVLTLVFALAGLVRDVGADP